MKNIKSIQIVFYLMLIFSLLYAKKERKKEYYKDGQLKSKIVESSKKSIRKVYYPDGQIKLKTIKYKKTNENFTTVYYENGNIKSIVSNKPDSTGKIIGIWHFFNSDGIKNTEIISENGKFISTEHFRDHSSKEESGEFIIEIICKKGKWKGRGGNFTRIYDKEGKLINETPLNESQKIK